MQGEEWAEGEGEEMTRRTTTTKTSMTTKMKTTTTTQQSNSAREREGLRVTVAIALVRGKRGDLTYSSSSRGQ